MATEEYVNLMRENGTLRLGEEVVVCWTNCGCAYEGTGTIAKINQMSVLVALSAPVNAVGGGGYPAGQKIKAPRINNLAEWSWNNRVYRVKQGDVRELA